MILGIDPGRDKAGWALTDPMGKLLLSGIFPMERSEPFFSCFSSGNTERLLACALEKRILPDGIRPSLCVVGNGTGRERILFFVSRAPFPSIVVPEQGTTLQARSLYWELHPPRGIWRLVPRTLRTPPRDVDDLAAWAIVLRHLQSIT